MWDRKVLQRAFAFADNVFWHVGIEPILRLASYINVISKNWILEENAKKEWLKRVDKKRNSRYLVLCHFAKFLSKCHRPFGAQKKEGLTGPLWSGSHLSSFFAFPFWSSLFCFCLELGFFQPYHHIPLARVLRSFMGPGSSVKTIGCFLCHLAQTTFDESSIALLHSFSL